MHHSYYTEFTTIATTTIMIIIVITIVIINSVSKMQIQMQALRLANNNYPA
jgi:hypothetical protein